MSTPYEQHPDHFLYLDSGIIVRLVLKGDRYGLGGLLVHGQHEPYVEFYDGDYDFSPWLGIKGQFISRYNLSTLLEHDSSGLDLEGGQPKWQINAQEVWYVRQWLCARHP